MPLMLGILRGVLVTCEPCVFVGCNHKQKRKPTAQLSPVVRGRRMTAVIDIVRIVAIVLLLLIVLLFLFILVRLVVTQRI